VQVGTTQTDGKLWRSQAVFSGFSLNPKKSEKKRFLFPWDLPVWALAAREWRVAAPWLKPFVSGVPDTNP